MSIKIIVLLFVCSLGLFVDCKVYERCELAKELKTVHKIPDKDLATWVCIARHESEYNTTAVGHMNWDGSGDHGLFQISDLFWCSPPGKGWACGVSCEKLEDDDIKDDVACIKRIHRQHQRLSGDGFSAWAVYRAHCSQDKVGKYIEGCFNNTAGESDLNNEVIKSEEKKEDSVQSSDEKKDDFVKPVSVAIQDIVLPTKDDTKIVKQDVYVDVQVEEVKPDSIKDGQVGIFHKSESKVQVESAKQGLKYDSVSNTGRNFDNFEKAKTKSNKRYNVKLYEFGTNVG